MQTHAVDGRHSDGPRHHILDFLKMIQEGIIGLNDLLAVLVESVALASQTKFLFATLDQQGIKLLFQRAYLLTPIVKDS